MQTKESATINNLESKDISKVMQLWLDININTHTFIDSNYWEENFNLVKSMIETADVYVYKLSGEIIAFVGLMDTYVAGIFVSDESRCKGIGKKLLDYIKKGYNELTLSVYEKNSRAINFYIREQFIIISKKTDKNTGEIEFLMKWKKIN